MNVLLKPQVLVYNFKSNVVLTTLLIQLFRLYTRKLTEAETGSHSSIFISTIICQRGNAVHSVRNEVVSP